MRNTAPFTNAQIRAIDMMRKRGKSFADIAETLGCCQNKVRDYLIKTGKHKPRQRTKTIRQILQEQRTKEEAEKIEREKGWCKLYCCNDRKSCMEIKHPKNCLVWQLYNDPEKEKIGKDVLIDRRKKQCQKTH